MKNFESWFGDVILYVSWGMFEVFPNNQNYG
jgi:hypothetical protein